MKIRAAELQDAEAIRAIYNLEVLESTVTFDIAARTLEQQQEWIELRSGVHPAIVVEDDLGEIAGFGSLSQYRDRAAYSTSVEDSVYVRRDTQGRGIGKMILNDLVERATAHGFHAVFARIAGDHETSISLHQRCGFEIVGHEREVGRKFGKWLDVILMERLLG